MKIYVSHSTAYDYTAELYEPLKREFAGLHEITFPHDAGTDFNSSEAIKSADLVLAEVSYPSTGQGIELGWANVARVPIVCIHKSGTTPSSALRHIAKEIVGYADEADMINTVSRLLRK